MPAAGGTGPRAPSRAVERYLEHLAARDGEAAVSLTARLLAEGMPAERIMLDVIGAAQVQVGQLWADNRWSVAQEHTATAISQRAVAAVAAGAGVEPYRGRVVVACVDGEWHALPERILAETLRLRGWHVDDLGASVPAPRLVAQVQRADTDTVALSCMLPTRLPQAHAAIVACQAAGAPVIAGGRGFGADGRYAHLLGADAWAPTAAAAADRLAAGDWPPSVVQPRPLPQVPGEEYPRLVRRRPVLLDAVLRRLAENDPSVVGCDQPQRDAVVGDLGDCVDFLAAALYVGDGVVLSDFVAWMTGVHAARGVPPTVLTASLEVLGGLLPEFPEARAMVTSVVRRAQAPAARD